MKNPILFISALLLSLACSTSSYAQRITVTVAGTGYSGFYGDNGPARKATLNAPNYVCIDAAHNIYFADQNNTRIRKVSGLTSQITTVAGGGTSSASGVPATDASITISGLSCDPSGNLYFTTTTSIVRKVDVATNIITTIGGGGTSIADGVLATTASFGYINGSCVDNASNVYVLAGNRVRKIDGTTGIVTTMAGNSTAGYSGDGGPAIDAVLSNPRYMAVDGVGNIYFCDQPGEIIRRIDAATGIITSVIGGGSTLFGCTGLSCMVGGISGMCCDGNGDVIFNEWSCSCRKWDHTTNWISVIGGDYYLESFNNDTTSNVAWMNNNYGICSDEANNYYIGDRGNHRIRKIALLTHTPTFVFGSGQYITPCPGSTYSIDSLLWVTDIDAMQPETWTVISGPTSGTLSGFPVSTLSTGIYQTAKPHGLTYTASSTVGTDAFTVRVTDGTYSDTITIYVSVQVPPTVTVTGANSVCPGYSIPMTASIPGGTWSVANPTATVTAAGYVTGVAAGVNTVSYNVNYGCLITATKSVTVNPAPATGIISGPDTVCVGGTITLTESITGGTWSSVSTYYATVGSSTGIVSGMVAYPGTIGIWYNVTNGLCTNAAIKYIRVFAPNAGVITGPATVCIGGSAVTFTSSVTGGAWSMYNPSATINPSTGLATGLASGLDTIKYTVVGTLGCAGSSIRTVNVTPYTVPSPGSISGPDDVCLGSPVVMTASVTGGVWSVTGTTATISATGVVTGVSLGTNNIHYVVDNGCATAMAVKVINVITIPDPGVISGSSAVCTGATTALTNPVSGGAWSASNTNVSISLSGIVLGALSGIDTIAYTVANACGTGTTSHIVHVNTTANPGAISGSNVLCAKDYTTMANTTASISGVWSTTTGNATVTLAGVLYGAHAGSDIVVYSVTNECGTITTTKDITVIACIPTDLPELSGAPSVRVYPNPATAVLSIAVKGMPTGTAEISITDVAGRVVLHDEISNTQKTKEINVSSLAGGIYLLSISGNGLQFVDKVVISK